MSKYRLINNTIKHNGRTLYQIQAVKSFGNVKEGDRGGWIESEDNLSHEGNCWVYDSAWIFGNAEVYYNAQVSGNAQVYGNAKVSDNTQVYGNAEVYGNAKVWLDSEVSHGEFSQNLYYRIHQHENNQIVYTENKNDTLIQIQYKGKTYKLNERLYSKEEIIEKALQLERIEKTDQDLLEGLL
jgi:hypothetical protein